MLTPNQQREFYQEALVFLQSRDIQRPIPSRQFTDFLDLGESYRIVIKGLGWVKFGRRGDGTWFSTYQSESGKMLKDRGHPVFRMFVN